MTSRPLTRAVAGLLTLLALAAAWWLLAPVQIGGGTGYAIVSGTSMEPGLNSGDLVLTRKQRSYGVGDAVLYQSDTLDAHVLHRVVGTERGRLVVRGDNRTENDPDTPTAGQVVGRLWVTIPGAGGLVVWLRQPLHLGILLFLLAFLVLSGGREVSRRRGRGRGEIRYDPHERSSGVQLTAAVRTGLAAGLVGAGLFGALALLAWSTPGSERATVDGGYAHTGTFAYTASVPPSAVYPGGTVSTGETAFTRLVRRLDVSFDYRFESPERNEVQGGIGLDAVVADGFGWSRSLAITPLKPFSGSVARVEGTLDLRRVDALTARLRALTGTSTTIFKLQLVPRVQVAGYAGSTVIDETFSPALSLSLDATALRLEGEDVQTALAPRLEGELERIEPTHVGVGALSLPTADARAFSALGLVVSLALAGISALLLSRRFTASGHERIGARYGTRIVDADAVVPEGRWVTEVGDIESLVRLADLYERVILHVAEGGGHTYLVDDGVAVYRHRLGAGAVAASRVSPVPGA
jgi:signal peptidase I